MEESGRLQSMGSLRVRHDWAISLSLFTFMHWRRKWQPTSVFLPGTGEPGGLPSMGLHRVGHDWSDLAAAAVFHLVNSRNGRMGCITYWKRTVKYIYIYIYTHTHTHYFAICPLITTPPIWSPDSSPHKYHKLTTRKVVPLTLCELNLKQKCEDFSLLILCYRV